MADKQERDKQERDKEEKGGLRSLLFSLWAGLNKRKDTGEVGEFALPPEEAAEEPQEGVPGQEESMAKDETLVPVKGHALFELYTYLQGMSLPQEEDATFSLSLFMGDKQLPDGEKKQWLSGFEREARGLLQKAKSEEEKAAGATAFVKIAADRMSAWLFLLPPVHEGEALSAEVVENLLEAAGVVFGVDEAMLQDVCEEQRYFALYQVAQGIPPVDGKDGEIIDHYRRDNEIHLTVKDDSTIDYKDLGWLQTILQEELICEIVPPVEPVPGMNVRGKEEKGKPGRKATAPKGQGIEFNADETALIAAMDGVVSFFSGRFRVDPLLIIKGDVGPEVGNLQVVGDLLVYGDIREGFTAEATGNITVQGMVEGAKVLAGGNIQIGRGMNGNSHGTLQAKGDVYSKFLENSTVTAGGKIVSDTVINSTISSDSAIEVKTGRGAIIGGNITALDRIEASTIGNMSNRSIAINMGSTANFLREKYELEQKHKETKEGIEELQKNIRFLLPDPVKPDPKVLQMLDDMKLKLTVQTLQLANLERKISIMERKQTDAADCRLKAEVIYPPAQITIGRYTKILRQTACQAVVYSKDGEIQVASV